MVREACLPDVALPLKGTASLKGESTFDKLDRLFKGNLWAEQEMNVIGHDDEVVKICLLVVAS
jgi:hypothetical protein